MCLNPIDCCPPASLTSPNSNNLKWGPSPGGGGSLVGRGQLWGLEFPGPSKPDPDPCLAQAPMVSGMTSKCSFRRWCQAPTSSLCVFHLLASGEEHPVIRGGWSEERRQEARRKAQPRGTQGARAGRECEPGPGLGLEVSKV